MKKSKAGKVVKVLDLVLKLEANSASCVFAYEPKTPNYVSGVYKYACANFSVYSNDGGANTVYANTIR